LAGEEAGSKLKDAEKLGVKIKCFQPKVENPDSLYQFNLPDDLSTLKQAIEISGPTRLHNGVVKVTDLRAGMCLFLSTLLSKGKSVLEGAEQIERGYEKLVAKFTALGAKIKLDSNG
jgi:UDP-N-acetylglucosamine enolpyruvyl transferase